MFTVYVDAGAKRLFEGGLLYSSFQITDKILKRSVPAVDVAVTLFSSSGVPPVSGSPTVIFILLITACAIATCGTAKKNTIRRHNKPTGANLVLHIILT